MAKVKDQTIKSARYYYYTTYLTEAYNSGFNFYDTKYGYIPKEVVKKRSPWNLPGFRGFDPVKIGPGPATARTVIKRISDIWKLQPLTNGVTPPQTGPRSKAWWRDNNPLEDPIYYRWFVLESSVYVKYFTRPPWEINNNLYIVDSGNNRIMRRNVNDFSLYNKIGSVGSGNDQFQDPRNISIDQSYIYIADTGNNRIVIRDKTTLAYVTQITSYGSPPQSFSDIRDIDTDNERLYIADAGIEKLIILDKQDLSLITLLDLKCETDEITFTPVAVAVSYYYIVVFDQANQRLKMYNRNNLQKRFHVPSKHDKSISFNNVTSIDLNAFYIWVTDSGNNRVLMLYTFYPAVFSEIGPGKEVDINLSNPQGVTISGEYLIITDTGNNRLVRLTTVPLDFDQFFGSAGTGAGQFNSPKGITAEFSHYFTPY